MCNDTKKKEKKIQNAKFVCEILCTMILNTPDGYFIPMHINHIVRCVNKNTTTSDSKCSHYYL